MRHISFLSLLVLLSLIPSGNSQEPPAWTKIQSAPHWREIKAILSHPHGSNLILADRQRVLQGHQNSWQTLWENSSASINGVIFSNENKEDLFILTNDGAYLCNAARKSSRKIYEGKSDNSRITLSFNSFGSKWFMGTAEGIFISPDFGKTWTNLSSIPKQPVIDIKHSSGEMVAATPTSLYKWEGDVFKKLFSLSPFEREEVNLKEFSEETPGESENLSPAIHEIFLHEKKLWLATDRGVFESKESETSWNLLSLSGLRSPQIQHLAYSTHQHRLFGSNTDGVFEYLFEESRWEELHKGLASPFTSEITVNSTENFLVAATREGLFQFPLNFETSPSTTAIHIPSPEKIILLKKLIRAEPSAREVQKQVIRYANLSNSKTKRWHWGSRAASILPSFSFGKDFSANNNVDLDRGGTGDPDKFIFGPDDIGKGWDMDLGWDFKDLIWSTAQTTIDSREKSMIELRDDFLANATRIFYERRRLQMDFVLNPPPLEKEFFERLLRIDELTSLLDAITNGNFEKLLGRIYKENPEFENLWEWLPETRQN